MSTPASLITALETDIVTGTEGDTADLIAILRGLDNYNLDFLIPEQYGAQRDGVTDDGTALQNALDAAGASATKKMVRLMPGTYKHNATLTIPKNVSLVGPGHGVCTLDSSGATGLTSGVSVTSAFSALSALPDLSADVEKAGRTLTFVSAPSIVQGDVLCIFNPTNESWSAFRTNYRAGEFVIVKSVSGTSVEIEGSLSDGYAAADVDIYKVPDMTTAKYAGLTIKGLKSGSTFGLRITHGHFCLVEDLRVFNVTYAGLGLKRCVGAQVRNCIAADDQVSALSTDYGLSIGNSQMVDVDGGYFNAGRHGITMGGGAEDGDVPVRHVRVRGAHVATSGDAAQAADIHGNCEYIMYDGCILDGGVTPGGDHTKITNNIIRGKQNNGPSAVYFGELKGHHHEVRGNHIETGQVATGRGIMVDIGGNSNAITSATTRGGIIDISDNKCIYTGTANTDRFVSVNNRGCVSSEEFGVSITGNKFEAPSSVFPLVGDVVVDQAVLVRAYSGNEMESIIVTDNEGIGGIRVLSDLSAGSTIAKRIILDRNALKQGDAVRAVDASELVSVCDNNLTEMRYASGYDGDATARAAMTRVHGNKLLRCGWGRTSSSTTRAPIQVWNAGDVMADANFISGAPEYLRIDTGVGITGTFTIGEQVTGGTSGATATIHELYTSEFFAILETRSGTFTNGETITGDDSGATADLHASAAVAAQNSYGYSFNDITELWTGHNVDASGEPVYKNSVTTDNAL
jgi:hypothetical protein